MGFIIHIANLVFFVYHKSNFLTYEFVAFYIFLKIYILNLNNINFMVIKFLVQYTKFKLIIL